MGKKLRTDLDEDSYEKYCERYALFQPEFEVPAANDAEGDDDVPCDTAPSMRVQRHSPYSSI